MIRFAAPWLLLGTAVLPLVAVVYWLSLRRLKGSVRMSDLGLVKGIRASLWARLRHAPFVLRLTALALLLVAFARPQAGSSQEEVLTRGIDIMLVMDNSTSMAAEDFKPRNRLA